MLILQLLLALAVWLVAVTVIRRLRHLQRVYREAESARQEAQATVGANEELMARVRHEWRGPLGTVGSSLWQLEHHGDSVAVRARATAVIGRALMLQRRLVADLLDHTRASHGKLSLELAPTTIKEPLWWAVQQTADNAAAKGITVHLLEHGGDAAIAADTLRLQQVFVNLLQNAVKFTPRGGSVTVAFARTRAHVQVSIVDTGVGIAREAIDQVFEPFYQSDQSHDAARGGIRLGLSVARDIVRLHHGELDVLSGGVGCGATFTVRLPAATDEACGEPTGSTCHAIEHGTVSESFMERPAKHRSLR